MSQSSKSSYEEPDSEYFRLCALMWSLTTTQIYPYSLRVAMDIMYMNVDHSFGLDLAHRPSFGDLIFFLLLYLRCNIMTFT